MKVVRQGFTIVELVVVIALIGILTAIALLGLSGFQANSRDQQRFAKATTISEALEKYYTANGEYPAVTAVTTTGSTVATKIGVQSKTLIMPGDAGTNSITALVTPTTTPAKNKIGYIGYIDTENQQSSLSGCAGDGSGNGGCDGFDLKYIKEEDNSTQTITSRRGDRIMLAVSGTGTASTVSLDMNGSKVRGTLSVASCTAPAITQYQLRYKINNGAFGTFTSWSTSRTLSTNEDSAAGYRYEFDGNVRCYNTSTFLGKETAVSSAVFMRTPDAPTTSIDWGAGNVYYSGAACGSGSTTQYQTRSRVNDGAWSGYSGWTSSPTTTGQAYTEGMKYGYQAKARCFDNTTNYSGENEGAEATYIRPVADPTSVPNLSNNGSGDGTNTTWSWSSNPGTCGAGTSPRYHFEFMDNNVGGAAQTVRSGFGGPGGGNDPYGTPYNTYTSGGQNSSTKGIRYNLRVRQYCQGTYLTSGWSGWSGDSIYYRPIVHNQTARIGHWIENISVAPETRLDGVTRPCAPLVNQIAVHIVYGNQDQGDTGRLPPSGTPGTYITATINDTYRLNISYYNHPKYYARYSFQTRCINTTNGETADQYGWGSKNNFDAPEFREYGVIKMMWNTGQYWRVTCEMASTFSVYNGQPNTEGYGTYMTGYAACDQTWDVYENHAQLTYTKASTGCNGGDSSNVYNVGNGVITGDC